MENIIKNKGLKVTPGRIDILGCLNKDNRPKTAEEIYKKLSQRYDLATIYRNLETFEKKGVIFKESVDKKDYYYLAESKHHHIVCRLCKKMQCIPCSHQKFNIKNFTNIKHQLLLTGVCNECHK